MKPRKITKAIVSYSAINEVNDYHFIIDENGIEKPVKKNPYWTSIATQPDEEGIYIAVIISPKADSKKQAETKESILSRFEGISVVDASIDIKEPINTPKEAKKGKKHEE